MEKSAHSAVKIAINWKKYVLFSSAIMCVLTLSIFSCDSFQPVSLQQSLQGIPNVKVIEGAENSTITLSKGKDSYFLVEISDISTNDHILPGIARAWCIDWRTPISTGSHNGIKLHTSYGDLSLKPINYLLNIKGSLMANDPELTYKEIQVAIWTLLHYPEFDLNKIRIDQLPRDMVSNGQYAFDRKKAEQIVQLVNSNIHSFEYNSASTYAVVAETPSDTQTIIIEVGESVWAYGQYSFRNQALREQLGITGEGKGQWGWIYEFDSSLSSASTELIAGGGNDDGSLPAHQVGTIIGTLDIAKNGNNLRVTYDAFPEYLLGDLHLWAGCSLEEFPLVGTGNVAPGRFPYSFDGVPANRYTFTVDIATLNCTGNIYFAAHAGDLFRIEDITIPNGPELGFEIIDLSQIGLTVAMDINDHGHIIGGNKYWNSETNTITTMPLTGRAMNDHGQVVGENYFWDKQSGLIKIEHPYFDLEVVSEYIVANDINNLSQVVGYAAVVDIVYDDENEDDYIYIDTEVGFFWQPTQVSYSELGFYITANGINDNAIIVGGHPVGAFVMERFQEELFINPNPTGWFSSEANAINIKNQVVGFAYFLQDEQTIASFDEDVRQKKVVDMKKLLNLTNTRGIYDYGHVVQLLKKKPFEQLKFAWVEEAASHKESIPFSNDKTIMDAEEKHRLINFALNSAYQSEAFIWDEIIGFISIGTLGGTWSNAWDINDNGQVVGYSDIGNGQHRAFYWDKQNGMVELPGYGGNSYARAINNKGQIVGYSYDGNGNIFPVQWNVTLN